MTPLMAATYFTVHTRACRRKYYPVCLYRCVVSGAVGGSARCICDEARCVCDSCVLEASVIHPVVVGFLRTIHLVLEAKYVSAGRVLTVELLLISHNIWQNPTFR